jgi:hypothetical protein
VGIHSQNLAYPGPEDRHICIGPLTRTPLKTPSDPALGRGRMLARGSQWRNTGSVGQNVGAVERQRPRIQRMNRERWICRSYEAKDEGGARGWAGWKQGVKVGASQAPEAVPSLANMGICTAPGSARVPVTCWEAENTGHSAALWGSSRWWTAWTAVPKANVPRTRTSPHNATRLHCRRPGTMTPANNTMNAKATRAQGIAPAMIGGGRDEVGA